MAAIVIALTSYAYIVAPNPPVSSSVHRGGAVVANLFGGVRWPWEDGEASDEAGKFVRHSELSPGAAPLGAVVCGFDDDSLEALGEAIEGVYDNADGEPIAHVPIAVLAQGDLRLPLRRILSELNNRDSILPDRPLQPNVPLVLLSGFSTVAVSSTVRSLRALELRGGKGQSKPMFAVVVPNALDKSLKVLIDEIEGDHLMNSEQAGDAGP